MYELLESAFCRKGLFLLFLLLFTTLYYVFYTVYYFLIVYITLFSYFLEKVREG